MTQNIRLIGLSLFLIVTFLSGVSHLSAQSNGGVPSTNDSTHATAVVQKDTVVTKVVVVPDTVKAATDGLSKSDSAGAKEEEVSTDPGDVVPQLTDIISFTKIFFAIITLIATFLGVRIFFSIMDTFSERYPNYRLFIKRLIPALRILIWVIALYFIIEGIFSPPAQTIYALLASVGIAVGFASQDILKNVFGGFMIILDRPFQVGDKVDIGGHYGEVSQIGLRSVRLVTPDDSIVSVPNGELMNKSVSNNNSGALDCQVVAEVYLPQDVDLQWVRKTAYNAAATSKYVFLKKPIAIITKNEIMNNQNLIKVRIKAYVLDIRYEFPFMSEMTQIFLEACKEEGVIGTNQPTTL